MRPLRTTMLIATLALAAAACGGKKDEATTPDPNANKVPETVPVTLVEVSQGDAACYVTVKDAAGADQTYPGTFDLCPGGGMDAGTLVGKQVLLGFGKASLIAASCEGDPECTDTEEVDAVMSITAAE